MNNTVTRKSVIETTAVFSKDNKHRYKLKIEWDKSKPSACIVMTYPSSADDLILDQTTMLVRNNAVKNGYGSISIVNIFSLIDIENPKSDRVNTSMLIEECSNADIIIVAYGRSMSYKEEKEKFLKLVSDYKEKLYTISDKNGQLYSHPLSPLVREWRLVKLKIDN